MKNKQKKFFQNAANAWYGEKADSYACQDEIKWQNLSGTAKALKALCEQIKPKKILELGVGTGRYFPVISGDEYTGVDICESMLKYARSREALLRKNGFKKVTFVQDEMLGFLSTLPESSFDFVFSIGCIGYHAEVNTVLMSAIKRILKPGGHLFLQTTQSSFLLKVKKWVRHVVAVLKAHTDQYYFFHTVSRKALEEKASESGFQIKWIREDASCHFDRPMLLSLLTTPAPQKFSFYRFNGRFAQFRDEENLQDYWRKLWAMHDSEMEEIFRQYKKGKLDNYKKIFLRYLPKNLPVLEAGCGLSQYVAALQGLGYNIEGVDYEPRVIERVKAADPSLNVYTGDIYNLNTKDNFYGGYISLGIFEHNPVSPKKGLEEACRVLHPDGVALISVPHLNASRRKKLQYVEEAETEALSGGRHFYQYYYSREEFGKLLEEAGLNVVEAIPYGIYAGLTRDYSWFSAVDKKLMKLWRLRAWLIVLLDDLPFSLGCRWAHMMMYVCRKSKKTGNGNFFVSSGAGGTENGVAVFSYHGVVEKRKDERLERNLHLLKDFESHVAILKKYKVLTLEELAEMLSSKGRIPDRAAVITFDDGYENNLLAAEILQRAHLPWAVFISTGCPGTEQTFWTAELSLLLLQGQASEVSLLGKKWNLETRIMREKAFQEIRSWLKPLPSEMKDEVLFALRPQFPSGETARLLKIFPSLRMLDWKQIKQLSGANVEIGSHGVSHEILHSAQTEGVIRDELRKSKSRIESELEKPCSFFAYPNGNSCSKSEEEARLAGYRLAFTTESGLVYFKSRFFALPRISPSSKREAVQWPVSKRLPSS